MSEFLSEEERELVKDSHFHIKDLSIMITSEMEKEEGRGLKTTTNVVFLNKNITNSVAQIILLTALNHIVNENLKAISPDTANRIEQIARTQSQRIHEALETVFQQFGITDGNKILDGMFSQVQTDVKKDGIT
jgi:hypothetical protein